MHENITICKVNFSLSRIRNNLPGKSHLDQGRMLFGETFKKETSLWLLLVCSTAPVLQGAAVIQDPRAAHRPLRDALGRT